MKYFQEFKATEKLAQLVKQFKLQDTVARNMVTGEYALNPKGLELINRLESSFQTQREDLKAKAEDAVEELAAQEFNLITVEGLDISLKPYQGQIIFKGEVTILPQTMAGEDSLINEALTVVPELFWVIHPESPLYSLPYRELVAEIQYYNFLVNLV